MLPIHFAPLQGFTESAYRLAHSKFAPGIHTYYTPFLRLEKGDIRAKDLRDLQTEHPYHLVPQIIVRDVEEFNLLTKAVTELGFKEIDINMGCPYPMQTKSGRGSGILPHPEKVREILDAIKNLSRSSQVASESLKFSIKMPLRQSRCTCTFSAISPVFPERPRCGVPWTACGRWRRCAKYCPALTEASRPDLPFRP